MIFLRNVLRAPIRSVMTAMGVAAGIALFVAITAITLDLRQQIDGATAAYNLEVVVFERRSTSPFSSRISPAQMQDLQCFRQLLLSHASAFYKQFNQRNDAF